MNSLKKQILLIAAGYAFAFLFSVATVRRANVIIDDGTRDPGGVFDVNGLMTADSLEEHSYVELEKASPEDTAEAAKIFDFFNESVKAAAPNSVFPAYLKRYKFVRENCSAVDARRSKLQQLEKPLFELGRHRVPKEVLLVISELKKPLVLPNTTLFWGGIADSTQSPSQVGSRYKFPTPHRGQSSDVSSIMETLQRRGTYESYSVADVKRLRAMKNELAIVESWIRDQHAELDRYLATIRAAGDEIAMTVPVTGYENYDLRIDFVDTFSRDPTLIIKSVPRIADVPYRHSMDNDPMYPVPRTVDKPERLFWERRAQHERPHDLH